MTALEHVFGRRRIPVAPPSTRRVPSLAADPLVDFLGTCVILAWAMHEIVHHHDVARGVGSS